MPRAPHLRLVAETDSSVDHTAAALPVAVLCGASVGNDSWVADLLKRNGFAIRRRDCLAAARADLTPGTPSVALLAADHTEYDDAIDELLRLPKTYRRRVLLLSVGLSSQAVGTFVDAGVGDFARMPCSKSELLLRLTMRVQAGRHLPPARGDGLLDDAVPSTVARLPRLSERESLLLDILLENPGTPVTRDEILRRVWRRPASARSSNIVDVYVRYLRVKLADARSPVTIETVRHVGYRALVSNSLTGAY